MLNYLFTLVFPSLSSLFSLLASRHLPSPVICRAFHMMKSVSTFCTHSSADCNFSSAVESEVLGFAGFFSLHKDQMMILLSSDSPYDSSHQHLRCVKKIFFHSHSNSSSLRAHVIFTRSFFTRSSSSDFPQVREYKLLFWNSPNWSVFNFHEMIYVLTLWAVAEGGWHQMMSKADDDSALGD